MKRMTYFVMALALVLGLSQCKKEQPATPQNEGNGVMITLNVGGNNNGAKVNVDPDAENQVTFEDGDQILVASGGSYVGTLTREGGVFAGTITDPTEGQRLYFYFLGNKQGTLEAGATSCTVNISDQTTAAGLPVISMGKSTVDYSSDETSYTSRLYNKCSLMKFVVTTPSTAAICITGMNNEVTVDFSNPTDDGFEYGMNTEDGGLIKMPAKDANDETWAIVLPQKELSEGNEGTAFTEDQSYIGTRPTIHAIESNKFYHEGADVISMTVNAQVWDGNLSILTGNEPAGFATARNGMTVYGTLSANVKVSIADGATVTLDGANISYTGNGADYAGLTCLGDATIVLGDGTTNTVVGGLDGGGYSNWPGIFIPAGSTLTINGNTGVLNARRGGDDVDDGSPAGIGASWKNPCGNIVINGGVINAEGGAKAAGIGGCCWRGCGDITINGGTITATGHMWGTGIGLGGTENANSFTSLSGGNITITGGTVVANGGRYGAGIGTGIADHKDGNTMTITLGNILISGGTVTATGGQYGAGIGTGETVGANSNYCGTITIEGGTVTATGGERAAGIGAGSNQGSGVNQCGNITITSGVTRVTATKGSSANHSIGSGYNATCGTVTIGGIVGAISASPYTYEP